MQATLNIRLDKTLKDRGEKVLKSNGITVSEAVRGLWEEMVATREVPSFLRPRSDIESQKRKKLKALKELGNLCAGIGDGANASLDRILNMSDDELRDHMYEEKYREYLSLK